MKKIRNFLKEEKASAIILEYTIILPLVMAVVGILVFSGYIQHQKTVLQAATTRGAILASRSISDPNYSTIVETDSKHDGNDITKIVINGDSYKKTEPYRYLFRTSGGLSSAKIDVENIIENNSLFLNDDHIKPVVTAKEVAGVFRKVVVTANQDYKVPVILPGIKLPSFLTIESESTIYVNQPAEFIRNADFAIDLIQPLVVSVATKVNTIFKKVSFFSKD